MQPTGVQANFHNSGDADGLCGEDAQCVAAPLSSQSVPPESALEAEPSKRQGQEQPNPFSAVFREGATTSLSSAALPSADDRQSLAHMTEQYARLRARLQMSTTDRPSGHSELLRRLDAVFIDYLERHHTIFQSDPLAAEQLCTHADRTYDQARVEILKRRFEQLGEKMGLCLSRSGSPAAYSALAERATVALQHAEKTCGDLFTRYHLAHADTQQLQQLFHLPSSSQLPPVPDLQCVLRGFLQRGEDRGIQQRLEAERRAIELYSVNRGLFRLFPAGIRYRRIEEIMRNATPESASRISEAFKSRYGVSPLLYFGTSLGSTRRTQLIATLEGNAHAVTAHSLHALISRRRPDGARIIDLYRSLSTADIARVEKEWGSRCRAASQRGAESLDALLLRRLPPRCHAEISALRRGDRLNADVYAIARLGNGPRNAREKIRTIIAQYRGEKTPALSAAYLAATGVPLSKVVEQLPHGGARDLCGAILASDGPRTTAALIRCALQYQEDWVVEPFDNHSPAERAEMIATYERIYHPQTAGAFWPELQQALWMYDYGILRHIPPLCRFFDATNFPFPNSYPFIRALIERGTLEPHELLRFFMVGVGTDEIGIRRIFRTMSGERIQQVKESYAAAYPPQGIARFVTQTPLLRQMFLRGDLESDLDAELSGDSLYDVQRFMRGRPQNAAELRAQLQERFAHEQSGALLRRLKLETLVGVRIERQLMEQDVNRALQFYADHRLDQEQTPEQRRQFEVLAQYARIDLDTFRVIKNNIGCGVSSFIATLGATLGTLPAVLLHEARYPVIAGLAFLGSLGTRWLVKSQIIGAAYHQKEKWWDSFYAFADGLTLWLGRAAMTVSEFISIAGSHLAVRSGFRAGLRKVVKAMEDRIVHQNRRDYVPCPEESRGPERIDPPDHHIEAFERWLEARSADQSPVTEAVAQGVMRGFTRRPQTPYRGDWAAPAPAGPN